MIHSLKQKLLFGPYGGITENEVDLFKSSAANTIWFHDFNETLFNLSEKISCNACVEFKTFRGDYKKNPKLLPLGIDGKRLQYSSMFQGICLSQHEYLQEIVENLINGLKKFTPYGIWLDYMTFGGWFETTAPDLQDSCFCSECINTFQNKYNIDISSPLEIRNKYYKEWIRYKSDTITDYAENYNAIIKKYAPDCIVGIYMCPWKPDEFSGALENIFGQNYRKLAPYTDFFTPLLYARKSGKPAEWGRRFLENSKQFIPDQSRAQLIIDFLDYPDSLQEIADSKVPSAGIQIFNGKAIFESIENVKIFDTCVKKIISRCNQ